MKKIRKVLLFAVMLSFFIVNVAFAMKLDWASTPGHHGSSVLLDEGVTSAEDFIYRFGRGDYLAEGYVEITNMQDGTLLVEAMTLSHVNVDRILHSIFVDVWDEERDDWVIVDYWDIERTKEEVENGELFMLSTSITLTNCEVGRYYRARGLHGVELYDELEACATETHGVQLTDWRDW